MSRKEAEEDEWKQANGARILETDKIILKPCPFCGGKMEPTVMCFQHLHDQSYLDWLKENKMLPPIMTGFNSGYVVHCYHCGAKTAERLTKQDAAKLWNRRI